MNNYCPIPGASQPIQLDKNNNFIDPVTGELMHVLTVEEMPRHTFGAELYAQTKEQPFKIKPHCENCGAELLCNECGDIPDRCPQCGIAINWKDIEEMENEHDFKI